MHYILTIFIRPRKKSFVNVPKNFSKKSTNEPLDWRKSMETKTKLTCSTCSYSGVGEKLVDFQTRYDMNTALHKIIK